MTFGKVGQFTIQHYIYVFYDRVIQFSQTANCSYVYTTGYTFFFCRFFPCTLPWLLYH